MDEKDHLSINGLQQIINIKASMNNGITDKLKYEFSLSKFIPVAKPLIVTNNIPDPN
jgi:hypothetical protein